MEPVRRRHLCMQQRPLLPLRSFLACFRSAARPICSSEHLVLRIVGTFFSMLQRPSLLPSCSNFASASFFVSSSANPDPQRTQLLLLLHASASPTRCSHAVPGRELSALCKPFVSSPGNTSILTLI